MPKSNKCCPSSKSHHGSCVEKCVEKCVKECKELYCKAKYEKFACKLLKTNLIQNKCDYVADRFVDSVSGAKFNWLNNFLISNAVPTVVYQGVNTNTLTPASFGSETAFTEVDPTLNNFVFAYTLNQDSLMNYSFGVGNAVPILQDVFEYIYDINVYPPLVFGTSSLNQILATPTVPALVSYTQAQVAAILSIIKKIPYQSVIIGQYGVPLLKEVRYQDNTADNTTVNKVARIGLIKLQNITNANFVVNESVPVPVVVNSTVGANDIYVLYGYGRVECPDLC